MQSLQSESCQPVFTLETQLSAVADATLVVPRGVFLDGEERLCPQETRYLATVDRDDNVCLWDLTERCVAVRAQMDDLWVTYFGHRQQGAGKEKAPPPRRNVKGLMAVMDVTAELLTDEECRGDSDSACGVRHFALLVQGRDQRLAVVLISLADPFSSQRRAMTNAPVVSIAAWVPVPQFGFCHATVLSRQQNAEKNLWVATPGELLSAGASQPLGAMMHVWKLHRCDDEDAEEGEPRGLLFRMRFVDCGIVAAVHRPVRCGQLMSLSLGSYPENGIPFAAICGTESGHATITVYGSMPSGIHSTQSGEPAADDDDDGEDASSFMSTTFALRCSSEPIMNAQLVGETRTFLIVVSSDGMVQAYPLDWALINHGSRHTDHAAGAATHDDAVQCKRRVVPLTLPLLWEHKSVAGIGSLIAVPWLMVDSQQSEHSPPLLVTGGWDGHVTLLHLGSGTPITSLEWHEKSVTSVVALPVCPTRGGSVKSFLPQFGRAVRQSRLGRDSAMSSKNAHALILVTTGEDGRIAVWRLELSPQMI